MDKITHASEWIKYAEADLDAALLLTTHHPIHIEIICFHCQQAGEKALKAILAYHGEEISKTHDLTVVLESCEKHYPGITNKLIEQGDNLTKYAVTLRYPTEIRITTEAMNQAISNAKQILSHIKSLW